MITVEKFLCFKLETGGLFFGWLTLISSILAAIISFLGIIGFSVSDCQPLFDLLEMHEHDGKDCSVLRGVFIGVFVVLILLGIGFAYIGYLCVKGTRERIHTKVKPLMILYAISAVLSLLNIFSFTVDGIVGGIVNGIINAYIFVVLYSLYDLLRQEAERGANRQYQQPAYKV